MKHATIKKPIIVTETGIPDRDDSRRELWATSYLHAVKAPLFHGLCILFWLIRFPLPAHDWLAAPKPNLTLALLVTSEDTTALQMENAVADGADVRGLM